MILEYYVKGNHAEMVMSLGAEIEEAKTEIQDIGLENVAARADLEYQAEEERYSYL